MSWQVYGWKVGSKDLFFEIGKKPCQVSVLFRSRDGGERYNMDDELENALEMRWEEKMG